MPENEMTRLETALAALDPRPAALDRDRLMFLAGFLLTLGCATRVVCEVLAYQNYASWVWRVLPVSALVELSALTLFAINMMGTFILQPTHSVKEPMVARIAEAARYPKIRMNNWLIRNQTLNSESNMQCGRIRKLE